MVLHRWIFPDSRTRKENQNHKRTDHQELRFNLFLTIHPKMENSCVARSLTITTSSRRRSVAVFLLAAFLGTQVQGTNSQILACYYQQTAYFPPSDVPADLCTHVIYAFGTITDSGSSGPGIVAPTSGQAAAWGTLTALKTVNPALRILLSLQQGFPTVVGSDVGKMQTFATNAIALLRQYLLDGVDFDWEFPKSTDKENYATFLKIVRNAVQDEAQRTGRTPLVVSLALANNWAVALNGYDFDAIASSVDFATMMAYDFHLYIKNVDERTGYNSPLFTTPGDPKYFSASALAQMYATKIQPAEKLLLGIPTYGRSWKLASASNHGLQAPAIGKGDPGPYRHITGVYSFSDACVSGGTVVEDSALGAAYLYAGQTWVSFDNQMTVQAKSQWANQNGLGGVGVWSLTLDDVDGVCGKRFPLVNTIKDIIQPGPGVSSHNFRSVPMLDLQHASVVKMTQN